MVAVCSAFAIATEPSESALSATAAFTGAATLALMSDMAARSGNSSPAISLSSSRVRGLYSCGLCSVMFDLLAGLVDGRRLLGVRVRDRVVGCDVQRRGEVHRRGHVGCDQRHRGALGQLLAGELVELLAAERLVIG